MGLKTLTCKHCGGEMVRKKVYRLGGCLGAIGTFFGVIGLLAALIGGLATWAGAKATVDTVDQIDRTAYEAVLKEFDAIEGGPWPFVQEFREKKRISAETLKEIPEPPRGRVKAILEAHDLHVAASTTGAVIGGGFLAGMGSAVFVAGLLGLVLGLLLSLMKKVWRCRSCGAVVDRM